MWYYNTVQMWAFETIITIRGYEMTFAQTLMETLGKSLGKNDLYRLLIIEQEKESEILVFKTKMGLAKEIQQRINKSIPWKQFPIYSILHNGEFQLFSGSVRMYAKSFKEGESIQLSA